VGLILLWNQPFWPVSPYNTWAILLLSYCCLLLPWPVRYVGSALRQLGGIWNPPPVFTAPVRCRRCVYCSAAGLSGLLAAMLMVFAIASRELVTSLLLAPADANGGGLYLAAV
jgi:iron(III) transport system permease protein